MTYELKNTTASLTGFGWPHEAERQEAYILIRDTLGTWAWFQGSFDKMEGDVALKAAKDVTEQYWHIHMIL